MILDEVARERIRASIHLPNLVQTSAPSTNASVKWWHHAVLYQVYLKSFADASGDGVGDIAGLIDRLPYLQELGVDALWISPWFVSPMVDGGYDVQDYFDIDPLFGSIDDAQRLIDSCHERGLRVVLDMVANHCSNQHPWFQAALAAPPHAKERDWFYFKDGRGDGGEQPPNDWKSIFGGPAWTQTFDSEGTPGQWYLNLFDSSQPDLNWKNEEVLRQFDDILRFWFDRGVDGFRLDAVAAIGKDDDYRDMGFAPGDLYRPDVWGPVPFFDADGVHAVLRRWRRIAREYPSEKFLVGEVPVRDVERLANYLRNDELHSTLSFEMSKIEWGAKSFRTMADTLHGATFQGHSWKTWTLSSHDEKRTVTRYSSGPFTSERADETSLGGPRARAGYLLTLALPGSACIYQGEELGLTEVLDIPPHRLQDPVFFRTGQQSLGRDGCRVPLPWESEGATFGFSSHDDAWLPQPRSWSELSIARQRVDETSTYRFFQAALALRCTVLDPDHWDITWESAPDGILILRRGAHFRCVVNFSGAPWPIPDHESILISSSPLHGSRDLRENNSVWLRSND
jgi:alpha-glucosidase